jgi:predicted TIM-barrel fold metal-dependent hydrolase
MRIIAIEEHAFPTDLDLPGAMGSGMPGVLDELDDLGEGLARADERLNHASRGERTVWRTVLDQVVITTAGYTTAPPLACALATFGPERIVFSIDHPFADSRQATSFLAGAALDDADRERIAHGNAEALLGL